MRADFQERTDVAYAALRTDPEMALTLVLPLLEETWVLEHEGYDEWLLIAGEALTRLDRPAEAAWTYLYRGYTDRPLELLRGEAVALDRALVLERMGRTEEAAQLYQRLGWWARAARALSAPRSSAAPGRVREAWEAAVAAYPEDVDLVGSVYARLGLAQTLIEAGDPEAADLDGALVGLSRLAVDAEEAGRLREATVAYRTLEAVGRARGEVEHILEGVVNRARLADDRGDALEALGHRLRGARRCIELGAVQAAAELLQEAAEDAGGRLVTLAMWCWDAAARCWADCASGYQAARLPAGFVENALLARIDALSRVPGAASITAIATTFEHLSTLPLADARQARYRAAAERQRLAARTAQADPPMLRGPDRTLTDDDAVESWGSPLADRELGRAPLQVVKTLLLDGRWPGEQRRALHTIISARGESTADPAVARPVVQLLAGLPERASARAALRRLAEHPRLGVRTDVAMALWTRTDAEAADVLLRLAADRSDSVARTAGRALAETARPRALGALAEAARTGPSAIAGPAIGGLESIGGEAAAEALFRAGQRTDDPEVALRARAAFDEVCDPAWRALFEAL
jgi:hypothetical protein